MSINLNSLVFSAISSLIGVAVGGLITLYTSTKIQNRNWENQTKREKENRDHRIKQIQSEFFMELHYNKRNIIYAIKNANYILADLDNSHWKNFIYSEASHILMGDKKLVGDLTTLDSMADQTNNLIRHIRESETARISAGMNRSISGSGTIEKNRASLRQYLEDELMPQFGRVIPRLEKLFTGVQ